MKPFVVTAIAFFVASGLGMLIGAFAARFTPDDLNDVDLPDDEE